MTVINTNDKALISQNSLTVNNRKLTDAMQQLSTGKRINGAKDDAAGLAIASKMTAQVRGLNQAVRNANDGISLIQTAEGALTEVTNMLQRMRELAVQSANDSNTNSDRTALNAEFTALRSEINRIGNNTQFNSMNVLDKSFAGGTGAFKFQVGANADQTIDITIGDYRTNSGASTGTASVSTTAAVSAVGSQTATTATKQISTVTFNTTAGNFAVGEKVAITIGAHTFEHTVATSAKSASQLVSAILSDGTLGAFAGNAGVTVTAGGSGDSLTLTGATAGVTFTPTVSSTGLGAGTATVGTESAGTSTTRESNTIVLGGTYVAGDKLTINNGVSSLTYTVTSADVSGGLNTLAASVAEAGKGYFNNTTVDATGKAEVSKLSAITAGTAFVAGDKLTVDINGTVVETAALAGGETPSALADALVTAINANATTGALVTASKDDANNVILTGKTRGTSFTVGNVAVKAGGTGTITGGGVASETTAAVAPGPTLTFTAIEFGAGKLGSLTATITKAGSAAGTVSTATPVAAQTAQTAVAGVSATAQSSTYSFDGKLNKGDVISIGAGSVGATPRSFTYTVSEDDVAADDQGASIASNVALKMYQQGVTESISVSGNKVTLTGAAGTPFSASASVSSRVSTGSADLAMINTSSITTLAGANNAMTALDSALEVVSTGRATMGATINRLNYAADNLMATSTNAQQARSRIEDTDYAKVTTELARSQIVQQAATAMLAQANQQPQTVLSLLQ